MWRRSRSRTGGVDIVSGTPRHTARKIMADKTFSTLALGTRQDAGTWDKGCAAVGLKALTSIRNPAPDMASLKAFFAESPDWLYLGGHFGGLSLFNDAYYAGAKTGKVDIEFVSDHVEVRIDGTTEKLSRDDGTFQLHKKVVVVLWGGCSVCDSVLTLRTLRSLFDKHVLLGFSGSTGVAMVDAILGNGFIKKKHFFDNVRGKTTVADDAARAWMTAAKEGYGAGAMSDRFPAVDYEGQGWQLDGGGITKWIKV